MKLTKKQILTVSSIILVLIAVFIVLKVVINYKSINGNEILNSKILKKSLEMGQDFLINNQKENGSFNYEYNWKTDELTKGDSEVRQAGAFWGLALIYNYNGNKKVEKALLKSLEFFRSRSILAADNTRYVAYKKNKKGKTGTTALVTLAYIDYLRSLGKSISTEQYEEYKKELNQYVDFLLKARMGNGLWHKTYRVNGTPYGPSSPYFDGEALLALIRAAKYMGRDDLFPGIMESADNGYKINIENALKINPDSKTTKGYYQWSSMVYYELATSSESDTEKYGNHIISLADWMIDVHRTLQRRRNTGYAYEGIIHAYEIARLRNDNEHMEKYKKVIEQGLRKLTSWQVGHPIANSFIKKDLKANNKGLGGIQNHKSEPQLRIDVTQHQMHAVILALRYLYK